MPNDKNIYRYGEKEYEECKKIRDYYIKCFPGKKPLVYVKTYGCQQNVSDSEKYLGMFEEMGFTQTGEVRSADVVLFNTCAIRENAENKAFGNLGMLKNLKKFNPHMIIVLCGCMTQQKAISEKVKATYPFVDIVLGTHFFHKFPSLLFEVLCTKSSIPKSICESSEDELIFEGFPSKRGNRPKAFLSVMYGCNNFCSYCIVPYVRGRERSREPEDIIKEFKTLLKQGYKDITLLGQNVNSYGKGLQETIDFPELLKRLDNFEGEYRIRFMTSHPKDATKKLIDTIAKSNHVVHHIHLPVQSGSNAVLQKMNRKYTKESYLKIINYAKSVIPDVTFTSDIIIGFPGETQEEFSETLELIEKVKFSSLFTFIYSPRPGTPAAKMDDPVSKQEKTKRILRLLAVQEEISKKICQGFIGKTLRILIEGFDKEKGRILCRTQGNIKLEADGSENMVGKFVDAYISNSHRESLEGKIIL